LDLFCTSIGQINRDILLDNGLQEEVSEQLKGLLPFERKNLDKGLKYLGFVLKPNDYQFRIGISFSKKNQTRISFWVYQWTIKRREINYAEVNFEKHPNVLGFNC
jgi:hypothetical protein